MTISFARQQFPPEIIRHAVWLYVRFTLSYRDVEDLLAERGPDVSYETVRRWVLKFGPLFARRSASLETKRSGHGKRLPLPKPELGPPDCARPI
jgi:transposase-like protein